MVRRIRRHVRSNVVAYIALFFALGGSATALSGQNRIFSDDIKDGQVKRPDVAANAINTGKIGAGQVRGSDLGAGSVNGAKVSDGELTGADIAADGLGGAQVDEGSLGEVPLATLAGHGRSDGANNFCDPESTAYKWCGEVVTILPGRGRVVVHAFGNGFTDSNADTGRGNCAIYTFQTGGFPDAILVRTSDNVGGEFSISVVTPPLGPGQTTFEVHCNEEASGINYGNVGITVVQLSPS